MHKLRIALLDIAIRFFGKHTNPDIPKEPLFERDGFWGPLGVGLTLIGLFISWALHDFKWALYGSFIFLVWTSWVVIRYVPVAKSIRYVLLFASSGSILWGLRIADVKFSPAPEPPPETAVFMECQMQNLPLKVPPRTQADVVLLAKPRIVREKWGFYRIPNISNTEMPWPDPKLVDAARKKHEFTMGIAFVCRVSNHGVAPLLHIGIPIDLWFGSESGEKNRIRYSPIISALDPGKPAEFYLVNTCDVPVIGIWQGKATAQIAGETERRDIPLRRTYASPMDQILPMLPSAANWANEPCN